MRFIGVDPGQSGAIAWVDDGGQVQVVKMPETEREVWDALYGLTVREKFPATDDPACIVTYEKLHCFAVIEDVHSMPGQGVSSSFKFGRGYGGLRMALIGLGIPFRAVTPAKWQKALGCLTAGDKRVSKRRAQELCPGVKVTLVNADALLIALYARANAERLMGRES
jgi:crossover junction endodeoxyribonuclease RuvC